MTISAKTSTNQNIIGYINGTYTTLAFNGSARRFNVSSSIDADVGGLINPSANIYTAAWNMIFYFDAMPTQPQFLDSPLPTANMGSCAVVRFGQQTDTFSLNYQSQKSPVYGYNPQILSSTYPRARYNFPNQGTVSVASLRSQFFNSGGSFTSGDAMYIFSPQAENGDVTLILQVQYCITYYNAISNYAILDS